MCMYLLLIQIQKSFAQVFESLSSLSTETLISGLQFLHWWWHHSSHFVGRIGHICLLCSIESGGLYKYFGSTCIPSEIKWTAVKALKNSSIYVSFTLHGSPLCNAGANHSPCLCILFMNFTWNHYHFCIQFFFSSGSRNLNRLLHLKDTFIRPELWVQHILKIGTAQNLLTAVALLLPYNCHRPTQNDDAIPHPPDVFAPILGHQPWIQKSWFPSQSK